MLSQQSQLGRLVNAVFFDTYNYVSCTLVHNINGSVGS